jgi:methylase of polypeptide subunit release factors
MVKEGSLDLGCGAGLIAIPLWHHFQEVIGLDPDPRYAPRKHNSKH